MIDDAVLNREFLFIPRAHVAKRTQRALIWKAPSLMKMECWEPHLDSLIARVETYLGFELYCPVHVVVYDSNEQAQSCLNRRVPPNMLLTPVVGAPASVIAIQRATAHPANGDLVRMKRHLCHELTHVLVALRTKSTKRLGDRGANMRVASWVNEGLAECVAATVCNQPDRLLRARSHADSLGDPIDIAAAFDDLCSTRRAEAFSIATARVWEGIRAHGIRCVFQNLAVPSLWSEATREDGAAQQALHLTGPP